MNAQLKRNCPSCSNQLLRIKCEARTYHYVIEENGTQYSIWEHSGSHHTHSHPPVGRRPPRSVPLPPVKRARVASQPAGGKVSKSRQTARTFMETQKTNKLTPSVSPSPPLLNKPTPSVSLSPSLLNKPKPLPRDIDCEGCGEHSIGRITAEEFMECDQCNKLSHFKCMQSPVELGLHNEDRTWSCPSCWGIMVWADAK
jgi:hypothetical protein